MSKLISCDWGTSALRLRVVDTDPLSVQAEAASDQGIATTFNLWKQSNKEENERLPFYQAILSIETIKMEAEIGGSLQDVPLIISGMASSSIGMIELPYKEVPVNTRGHDLGIKIIEATKDFRHTTLLISGIKTGDDVMRGEETQLLGCLQNDDKEEKLYVLPGTHSKHVMINDGRVTGFKTYMTGEFFELLSKKSILSNVVEKGKNSPGEHNVENFEKGITDGLDSNLLHSSFLVRTNHLFGKISKEENYYYLSGLLIGNELKELININIPLVVVGNESLIKWYATALQKLGIDGVKYFDAGEAVINGHCKIYDLYKSGF